MKKLLIFLGVFLSFSFLFCLGASAESLVREDTLNDGVSIRSVSPDYSYTYLSFRSPVSHIVYSSSYFDFSCNGYYFYNGSRVNFDLIRFYSESYNNVFNAGGHGLISPSGVIDPYWDGILYFDSPTVLPSILVDWYNLNQPNLENSSFSGVTSTLTFSGQVLDFITSTEGILSLLGLSVGLCLIVPFSIRKFKDFVKGY